MLPTANNQVLEALKRLSENPDWDTMRAWLKEGREIARDRLELVQGDDYRTIQGQAQMLSSLLKSVEGAREAIARKQKSGNR